MLFGDLGWEEEPGIKAQVEGWQRYAFAAMPLCDSCRG
jgi:hypothetical protein